MRKVKTTCEPMFSNGTEAMIWIGNNCDKCWKQSHYNEDKNTWSNDKCSIDRDIQSQMAGIDEIYERSYTMVKNNSICPNRQAVKPTVHKKRVSKVQSDMFSETNNK